MVDIRKKIRGRRDRRLHWKSWKDQMPAHLRHKRRTLEDEPIGPGFMLTEFNIIPPEHFSSRVMQDYIEEKMKRKIAREPPGKRRDYMRSIFNHWLQGGRPTAQDQALGRDYKRDTNAYENKRLMEMTPTWKKGRPQYMDHVGTNEPDSKKKKKDLKV